jgi:hypothetical protein
MRVRKHDVKIYIQQYRYQLIPQYESEITLEQGEGIEYGIINEVSQCFETKRR